MDPNVMTSLHDLITQLDRDLALAELQDTSQVMAMDTNVEKMRKFVLVRIDSHNIAIPIEGLAEIGPMPHITTLPNLPNWLFGIINHRGDIISVSDMSRLFDEQMPQQPPKKKLAILHDGKIMAGIGIDQVITTVSRPESECLDTLNSPLCDTEPTVFGKTLNIDDSGYQILEAGAFLKMDRLMRYQLSD